MRLFVFVLFVLCFFDSKAQVIPDFTSTVKMAENPISVREWKAFMGFIKSDKNFSAEYVKSMTPKDWQRNITTTTSAEKAVLGITWNQAMAYCHWKSEVATYLHAHKNTTDFSRMKEDNKLAKTKISYRLPTQEEWSQSQAKNRTEGVQYICSTTSTR